MQHSTLTAPLIVCGFFSIILQFVGFFSPGWMIFSMDVDRVKLEASSGTEVGASTNVAIDVRMGLWTTMACVDRGYGKECGSVSTAEVEGKMALGSSTSNPGVQKLLGDWIALQVLVVNATISGIVGLIVLFGFARASDEKSLCKGGIVAVSWLISAILILAAVGKNANDQATYSMRSDELDSMDMGVSMKFELPWATIVSGIGGGFALVVAIVMALYLICRDRREAPGVWRQFESGKPV